MSLLETIIVFFFASILTVTGLQALSTFSKTNSVIAATRTDTFINAKVSALLEKVMQDTDTHRFTIPAKIHHAGIIQYADGINNPVMNSTTLKPANTDSISSLSLSLKTTYFTARPTPLNSSTFRACPNFATRLNNSPPQKSFLGVSNQGFVALIGTASLARDGCADFNLSVTQSMLLPLPNGSITNISLIIPILREYTLYVDKNDQLRFLSHEGANNIENQPLFRGIKQLSLSLLQNSAGGYELLSSIKTKNAFLKQQFFINHLSRMPSRDFFEILVAARI